MFERYKIKKLIQPRKEFTKETKTTFLAVFDATHPDARSAHAHGITRLARSFIAVGALVAVFAGMSVYADTANVGVESPLYPLKRLGESVQLAVAPPAEKAQLQATFATRRADEISDLETKNPTSTSIAGLSNDLNTSLSASLNDEQNAKLGDGQLTDFCNKVLAAIATSSVELHMNFQHGFDSKFIAQCGADLNATGTRMTTGTSTANATSSFYARFPFLFSIPSSTTAATGTREHGRGGLFYRLPPGATSTATSSMPHLPFERLFPRLNASSTPTSTIRINFRGGI